MGKQSNYKALCEQRLSYLRYMQMELAEIGKRLIDIREGKNIAIYGNQKVYDSVCNATNEVIYAHCNLVERVREEEELLKKL